VTAPHDTGPHDWQVYTGTGVPRVPIPAFPEAPPWRRYGGTGSIEVPADDGGETDRRIGSVRDQPRKPSREEVDAVNTALHLRRPLVVTGPIGVGKASLAYVVARELGLGPVLRWNVTARSTLAEGLGRPGRLGPLGTALLPYTCPRVLLIVALDRAPLDLPEEIMAMLDTGEFIVDTPDLMSHENIDVRVESNLVRCREFPVVIITSTAERDFSPSFLRQCLRLRMPMATPEQLTAWVIAQIGDTSGLDLDKLVAEFLTHDNLGADQLLNAVHLARRVPPDLATSVWHAVSLEEPE
jgi:MoxR-like ATPase